VRLFNPPPGDTTVLSGGQNKKNAMV